MISKHIDLIAVGFLLLALALFNGAKHCLVVSGLPFGHLQIHRAPIVRMPPMSRVPSAPALPHISLRYE